ncbi:hypothetical protein DIPPA_15467 [Diplonema papillatum]|nr:hypothetical protein DIPPA_15467 [Diplonema papillatum]
MNGAELASGVAWQGVLTKSGGGALSRSHERWFELRGNQLVYYADKPLGVIELSTSTFACDDGANQNTHSTVTRDFTIPSFHITYGTMPKGGGGLGGKIPA